MKRPGSPSSTSMYKVAALLSLVAFALLAAAFSGKAPSPLDTAAPADLFLAAAEEAAPSPKAAPEAKEKRKEVIVYVTSWCPACRMTTDYLRNKKIPFVVKDVEKNEQYMKEMVRKVGGYRGVPVLDINGRILLGFNPQVLDQLAK